MSAALRGAGGARRGRGPRRLLSPRAPKSNGNKKRGRGRGGRALRGVAARSCSYHVGGESGGGGGGRVRAVLEVRVVTRGRGGEGGRSGIRGKSGARRRSPKFIGSGSGNHAGAVRRARVESQGGRRLVQVALRIRHGPAHTYTRGPGGAAALGWGRAGAGAGRPRQPGSGTAPRPALGTTSRSLCPRSLLRSPLCLCPSHRGGGEGGSLFFFFFLSLPLPPRSRFPQGPAKMLSWKSQLLTPSARPGEAPPSRGVVRRPGRARARGGAQPAPGLRAPALPAPSTSSRAARGRAGADATFGVCRAAGRARYERSGSAIDVLRVRLPPFPPLPPPKVGRPYGAVRPALQPRSRPVGYRRAGSSRAGREGAQPSRGTGADRAVRTAPTARRLASAILSDRGDLFPTGNSPGLPPLVALPDPGRGKLLTPVLGPSPPAPLPARGGV